MISKPVTTKPAMSKRSASLALMVFVMELVFLPVSMNDANSQALFKQTREQCNECCQKAGNDPYYLEQCKLKCFRNHDYCLGSKAAAPEASPAPAKHEAPVEEHPPTPREVRQPAPPPKHEVQKPRFVWPNPLNLVPGREGEAATHILALNGITPQHPNYPQAMAAVQGILINFARNNPGGGALPTDQLQRIISQFR
ncbi:MAG: hypothetical protein ACP5U1_15630 [Desulfomonilaceae bacterium]